jgi:hypothetical protein
LRRLGALAVEQGGRRAGFPAFLLAHRDIESIVDMRQRPVPRPQLEIAVYRALGRKILWQVAPRAASLQIAYAAARMLICACMYFHKSAISRVDRPLAAVSMMVRPSIIETA